MIDEKNRKKKKLFQWNIYLNLCTHEYYYLYPISIHQSNYHCSLALRHIKTRVEIASET